jgi:hypothetical protein
LLFDQRDLAVGRSDLCRRGLGLLGILLDGFLLNVDLASLLRLSLLEEDLLGANGIFCILAAFLEFIREGDLVFASLFRSQTCQFGDQTDPAAF